MFYIGVDLGQRRDHTAIVAVERCAGRNQAGAVPLHVRHAERVALGMPYPKVVERVRAILSHES